MPGTLNITISWEGKRGPEQISRDLAAFGQRVATMSPAWQQVGEALLQDFAKNFESEGGVFGAWSKWAPLAASTQRERQRLGYGPDHPILQRTGRLYLGVTTKDAPDNVFEVRDNGLTIGTTTPYAGYHNSSGARTRLPRRAIIALSADRQGFGDPRKSVVGILNAYLREQLAELNLTARGFDQVG